MQYFKTKNSSISSVTRTLGSCFDDFLLYLSRAVSLTLFLPIYNIIWYLPQLFQPTFSLLILHSSIPITRNCSVYCSKFRTYFLLNFISVNISASNSPLPNIIPTHSPYVGSRHFCTLTIINLKTFFFWESAFKEGLGALLFRFLFFVSYDWQEILERFSHCSLPPQTVVFVIVLQKGFRMHHTLTNASINLEKCCCIVMKVST